MPIPAIGYQLSLGKEGLTFLYFAWDLWACLGLVWQEVLGNRGLGIPGSLWALEPREGCQRLVERES